MRPTIALVTGGNRGIGLEVVRQLAKKGVTTLLGSRDAKLGQAEAEKLKREGLDVSPIQLDVGELQSIRAARRAVEQGWKKLDILINNAGVYFDEGKLMHELPDGVFEQTLQVNLIGAFNLCREFIPLMKRERFGRIVNVSSGYGESRQLTAETGAYKLSKYALNGLTRILADEVDPAEIKINAVCPGWVRTRMGGALAPREPATAAEGIVWAALLPDDGPTGLFFRDRKQVPW